METEATTFGVLVNMGTSFELEAAAAAFMGGAAMSGGVGAVIGAIIGGFVTGVMRNGMSLVGVGVDWQQASLGMVLPFAVAFDVRNEYMSAS